MKYKIASFFAGIGGFDVAFERKGFSTRFLCEINPFCNDILQKHWPKVKKSEDINTLSAKEIPSVEVWCGGFPCQDISVARGASQRLGLSGARSGLFFRYAELIQECKPGLYDKKRLILRYKCSYMTKRDLKVPTSPLSIGVVGF